MEVAKLVRWICPRWTDNFFSSSIFLKFFAVTGGWKRLGCALGDSGSSGFRWFLSSGKNARGMLLTYYRQRPSCREVNKIFLYLISIAVIAVRIFIHSRQHFQYRRNDFLISQRRRRVTFLASLIKPLLFNWNWRKFIKHIETHECMFVLISVELFTPC